jgi:Gas vesicle protein K/Gas vesicle synthesis protein GvpL/GvpF
VIELVAIVRATAPPPPAPARAVAAGSGLVAVVAPAPDAEEEVTAEALWRREELVEQLMAGGDVLPVRYGTRFADDDEAARSVAARRASFAAALDHVRGAVEFAVRAPSPLLDALRPLARNVTVQRASAAYLVDRDMADAFRARVEELGADSLTGPWPPYSFTEPPGTLPANRIGADPDTVEQGLAQLVLTIVELLRQLMERQALRRIDAGGLTADQVERMGTTFMELDKRMTELREQFNLAPEDLNLDLGPLGRLL